MAEGNFRSLRDFYPYYLGEHQDRRCRRLHFIGTSLVLVILITAVIMQAWLLLIAVPVAGYGFAWAGHVIFEKNKPATFRHPLYSLICDFWMFKDILTGRIRL